MDKTFIEKVKKDGKNNNEINVEIYDEHEIDENKIALTLRGRKPDDIRKFFNVENNLLFCNINECTKKFSNNTSISSLRNHVYKYHVNMITNDINTNKSMNNSSSKKEINFHSRIAVAFAKNSLPISLIKNKYFKDAIIAFQENPNIFISKNELRNTIICESKKISDTFIKNLSSSKHPVTPSEQ